MVTAAVVTMLFVGLAAVVAGPVVYRFLSAPGSGRERLLEAAHGSATVLVARVMSALGLAMNGLISFAGLIDAPAVSTALNTYVGGRPAAFILTAAAVISELARRRTLKDA